MLAEFETERRLHLLRLILRPLLILTVLALPFAIQADIGSAPMSSTLQTGIGLVAFAFGVVAVQKRWVNLAALALFVGVSGVIINVLLNDGVFAAQLDLRTIPEFGLLVLPITIAGVFGGVRSLTLSTLAAAGFTCLGILLTPHAADLRGALATTDGLVLFTVPVSTELALGILILAATRSYRRTQRELVEVRVAYAREKELDRLKDQFISSVNHELRTPIMALQGYIELARELGGRGDLAHQDQLLSRGNEVVDHLADLVRSVLDVRRIESDAAAMRPTVCALHPLILSAVHLLDPREAGMQERSLHLQVPPDLTVYADPDRTRQVILNLLSNGCKYSPPGSPLEVTARRYAPGVEGRRRGHADVGEPVMVEIAIRDCGEGIPPEQAVLLFQRFVRLERDIASTVTGTGLGLAICRAYVEAMGGRIWIESSGVPGEGSTFRFTLPAASVAESELAPVPASVAGKSM
jgi:signal transduction histidine kinase